MESPIRSIVLSQVAKDQLSRLKRFTKIQNWNTLCRWGFCLSLAEEAPPSPIQNPADSNVEMTWKIFGGEYTDVYLAVLKQRMRNDGFPIDNEIIQQQFRLHVHRGLGYLSAMKLASIRDLLLIATKDVK